MKKMMFSIALAIASLNAAQAHTAPQANPMRFFVGMGLTGGGETLSTVEYTDGTEIDIRTGDLLAFVGGIDYQVTPTFSFQGSVGYHVATAGARNGHQRFSRIPLELLAYYHVAPNWRIGGGARYATSIKYSSGGAADVGDYKYDGSVGGVIEGEYLAGQHWGIKLRYVKEQVKEKGTNYKIDADHVGVFGHYYF
ncbi:MAG TPA: outer membrane beta-barrel protein [Telluria sp.]|jgi:hypothetical protein